MSEDQTEYWEQRWQSFIDASPIRLRRKEGSENMQRWNKMAAGFAKRTSAPEAEERRDQTIAWLKELGALKEDSRVLDIGAGPGNWSMPLAKSGGHVTALEPADAMADILQEKIDAAGIANISIDRRTWQDVDLAEDAFQGAFDLVFASMTPGIDGPQNLKKMMAASKGYCYLSTFSGSGWRNWYGDLWTAIFNESLDGQHGDIIHPFNLVYAMGFHPELRFNSWKTVDETPREKAIDDYLTHLEGFTDINDEIRQKVSAFVDERCKDGVLVQERSAYQGIMVWRVSGDTAEE